MHVKKPCLFLSICLLLSVSTIAQPVTIRARQGSLRFSWNTQTDKALLQNISSQSTIWQGSLLPAFWLQHAGKTQYVKAVVTGRSNDSLLNIAIGEVGSGTLSVQTNATGVSITNISVNWIGPAPRIIEMYFGTRSIRQDTVNVPALWDRPFIPDWSAGAFCIPGAKEGPAQSYFRMWDFGQTTIPLGNFGPSLGTPYGAAFPKPLLFGAMGSADGWICFGAGEIPDGALTLKVLSTKGCFQYLYREDLWGALPENNRTWNNPLKITFDSTAYGAFVRYYRSFPPVHRQEPATPRSTFNTWGMWRKKIYPLQSITDFSHRIGAELVVMDDGWESAQGSGKVYTDRFPNFEKDVSYIRDKKMDIGFWETVAWISDTLPYGLTSADLIVDTAGRPIRTNWSFDPQSPSYYCLDISSSRAKKYLQERTREHMLQWHPVLLKLDFGYGLPSPNMGVPRDPSIRGERYTYALMKTIVDAARSVNPTVMIMNYGISPLWLPVTDLISMDDQGDLWYEAKKGHAEWSIWASLVSQSDVLVSGSSSYDWSDDNEVLLNTAILGVPGASLPLENVTTGQMNRRLALNTWFRKTRKWEPAWFNSSTGDYDHPPVLKSWGRKEDGLLTALALRPDAKGRNMPTITFTGRWALISQDKKDIYQTSMLAVVPFDAGNIQLRSSKPVTIRKLSVDGYHEFTHWKWEKGLLAISVTADELSHTAGFLITR